MTTRVEMIIETLRARPELALTASRKGREV